MREPLELLSNKQIDSLDQAAAQQHLREAQNEIRWLRSEVDRLGAKLAFANKGFRTTEPALEAEMTRSPLMEGKVR